MFKTLEVCTRFLSCRSYGIVQIRKYTSLHPPPPKNVSDKLLKTCFEKNVSALPDFFPPQMMSNMALPVSPFSSSPAPFSVTSPICIRSPSTPSLASALPTLAPANQTHVPAKVNLDVSLFKFFYSAFLGSCRQNQFASSSSCLLKTGQDNVKIHVANKILPES